MDLDVRTEGTTIRQFVGYMPEYDCLPPDTSATDFVTHMARMSGLPSTSARERTAEVLRHVGLYEERYRAIGGYSTGMKQRVKLAQALVHDPRLLLLDEPTNGLDPAGRDEMLALVRRTGTEFGIAVVVASHLLGEIERVCDFLVAIDAGHLLRAAPLGSFTERTGVLAVEVEEGEAALTAALVARGLQAVADGRTVLFNVTEDRQYDIVRDAVAELGLPLVRMEQRRQSLEDLFRDDVPQPAAPPSPPPAVPPAAPVGGGGSA
jgi:ABC-2 type transport system ATP-binding protein